MRDHILLYINGQRCEVRLPLATMMLADFLRSERTLTGTKIVCAEGDCGACTVLRYFPLQTGGRKKDIVYEPINSCITLVAQMDGSSLITVDALAADRPGHRSERLSGVQEAMVQCNGSQCGFCTPGFVMALTGLAEKKYASKIAPSPHETKNAMTGNLCRCTGYEPILNAAQAIDLSKHDPLRNRFFSNEQSEELRKALKTPIALQSNGLAFHAPRDLKKAALLLSKDKTARIFSGGTDLGVQINKGKLQLPTLVSLHLIDALYSICTVPSSGRIRVGARATLAKVRRELKNKVPEFARLLDLFASPQIKNVATLVGNLANGSPIGDTLPFLLVAGTRIDVVGPEGKRVIAIEDLFTGYRKLSLKRGEFISAIDFEIPKKSEILRLYKVSQRKDLDISAISVALRIARDPRTKKIQTARVAFGGVSATPVRLPRTEKWLEGQRYSDLITDEVIQRIQQEITPIGDLRGSAAFRRVLTQNLVQLFLADLKQPGATS